MSVGLVIVTHGRTGAALLEEAEFILGQPLEQVRFVPFEASGSHTSGILAIHEAIAAADAGSGVLVMTDLIGSSPSNRATALLEHFDAVLVTGINLAMLIRVWNYRDQPLGNLARKAVEGGRQGIKIIQR